MNLDLYERRPQWMRRIPAGARIVRHYTWRTQLYNFVHMRVIPHSVRRWFFQ